MNLHQRQEPATLTDWTRRTASRIAPDRTVLIAGPTASGKSRLAHDIVAQGGGVIVNADALQVYGCWRILTARPSALDVAALPHRLFGHIGNDAPWSVGHWLRAVADVLAFGQRAVIVGGTGLYFGALTEGLAAIPPVPPAIRTEADTLRRTAGTEVMSADLDPATRARIDLRNPARVQRAWEVQRTTGRGLASWQDDTGAPLIALPDACALLIDPDRDRLARRIDARFDAMMAAGALDEVRAVRDGWEARSPWAQAIGAADLMAHLDGDIPLAVAVDAAKAATRQYAKRQRTWGRSRGAGWTRIDPDAM